MERERANLRVGIVGTGFMGRAHAEALRRLGVTIAGVVGSRPERAMAAGIGPVYDSLEAMLGDAALDVVHITSPNDQHAPQTLAAIAAGVHVVCEKPLAVTTAESRAMVDAATEAGVVHAVCFNQRFYPHNHQAAAMVRSGEIGAPRYVSGGYHQDWLLLDTDWNWRLVAERQGTLRAVADIGSHWLDLVQFITGRRVTAVCADLHTFIAERNHPVGEVETFGAASVAADAERVREPMVSDDAAGILLRFDDGSRGLCSVSQVNAGRKNYMFYEIAAETGCLAWNTESPEYLWIGHRGRPNEMLNTDAGLMHAAAGRTVQYPAGHVEGYPDTFRAMFAEVYDDVLRGQPSSSPTYPTFADGLRAQLILDAIAQSSEREAWVTVADGHAHSTGADR